MLKYKLVIEFQAQSPQKDFSQAQYMTEHWDNVKILLLGTDKRVKLLFRMPYHHIPGQKCTKSSRGLLAWKDRLHVFL